MNLHISTLLLAIFFTHSMQSYAQEDTDVNIIGYFLAADGLGKVSLTLMDILKDVCNIKFIPTQFSSRFQDVSPDIQHIIKAQKPNAQISLLTHLLQYAHMVPESYIKIAYSMIESTAIPQEWKEIFNNQFDAVVVPDEFLVDVYTNSGVTIPIFVIPCAMYIEKLINQTAQKEKQTPFVFGTACAFWQRKNFELLIDAFLALFKDRNDVVLKIHARFGYDEVKEHVITKCKDIKNIQVSIGPHSEKVYIDFLKSLDVLVLLSKGEGFSMTPREALALGIPCILSNNTSHKTICKTGFVRAVPSTIEEPAYYPIFKKNVGVHFNCLIEDAMNAMMDVYTHYPVYKAKALMARQWVMRYDVSQLKHTYLTLIKPKQIMLDSCNTIDQTGIIHTNSVNLYHKYQEIIAARQPQEAHQHAMVHNNQ